jgi:hypothetical protein
MYLRILAFALCILCPILVAQQPTTTDTGSPAATPVNAASSATLPQPHTLLDGTPVKLRLSETISSATARVGQEIPFEVVEELKVDDVVVLPKGAVAIAKVTEAVPKRRMGRTGKLDISISYARLADQEKAALRAIQENKGGGHVGAMTGAIVATSIVFFPAAPLFLFMRGKDITIPAGTEITAFVDGDMHLDMSRFGATQSAAAAQPMEQAAQASLLIESTPPGADIEVDGSFVGSTPSTLNVVPGNHDITVKKKGFADWNRKMNVSGGTVRINAEMEAVPDASNAPVNPTEGAAAAQSGPSN